MRRLITLAFAALLIGSCAPAVPDEADLPPMARADHDAAEACAEEAAS